MQRQIGGSQMGAALDRAKEALEGLCDDPLERSYGIMSRWTGRCKGERARAITIATVEPFKAAHQLRWACWFTEAPAGNRRGFALKGPASAGLSASRPSPPALRTVLAEITPGAASSPSRGRSCSPQRRAGREHGRLFNNGATSAVRQERLFNFSVLAPVTTATRRSCRCVAYGCALYNTGSPTRVSTDTGRPRSRLGPSRGPHVLPRRRFVQRRAPGFGGRVTSCLTAQRAAAVTTCRSACKHANLLPRR